MSVVRSEQRLRCPFCCSEAPAIKRSSGVRTELGHVRQRHYTCSCGASCKSIEVRRGISVVQHHDSWTRPRAKKNVDARSRN